MKTLTLVSLLAIAALMSGCVSVKHAEIDSATFNTAGWKSNAGVEGDAKIDSTNDVKPNTSLTP